MTNRLTRSLVFGITGVLVLLVALSTGLLSALFPASVDLRVFSFVWESRLIDPVASALLILIAVIAITGTERRTSSSSSGHEFNRDFKSDRNLLLIADEQLRPSDAVLSADVTPWNFKEYVFGHFRIFLILTLATIVLLASLIDRGATDDRPTQSLINNAIGLSTSGQILPALESIMQVMPSKYTPSAFTLYYFASGWEAEIQDWPAAERLSVLLARSAIAIENPDALVIGLIQYDRDKEAPLPASIDSTLMTTASSKGWRSIVLAAIVWQRTGESSQLVEELKSVSRTSPSSLGPEFQDAESAVQSYVKPYSDEG